MICNRALGAPAAYDNGLYHWPTVEWSVTYPIVPGLGNLHGRLAFNSTYFLYLASLNGTGQAHHVANGILYLALFVELFSLIRLLFQNPTRAPFASWLAFLLIVPVLREVADVTADNVSTPSNDVPVFILSIVLALASVTFVEQYSHSLKDQPDKSDSATSDFLYLVLLTATLITIKLSGAVFAITTLVSVVYLCRRAGPVPWRRWGVGAVIIFALLLGPWLARNVILSGYLVYPSTAIAFPVDWRIPPERVEEEANWIRSWARYPVEGSVYTEVLDNWNWLPSWTAQLLRTQGILTAGAMIVAGLVTLLGLRVARRTLSPLPSVAFVVLWPTLFSLIIWFFSAPAPRFALAPIWLLAAGVAALAAVQLMQAFPQVAPLFARTAVRWGYSLVLSALILYLITLDFHTAPAPVPQANVAPSRLADGSSVFVPVTGEFCWDALPCTPTVRPGVELRVPGSLKDGFRVE